MTTEARITINRNPDAPRSAPKLNPARHTNQALGDQVRRRRKQIHDQARVDAAVTEQQREEAKNAAPPPPREDIDSIEVPLRNGMTIEYGPPNGISLLDRIVRFYGGRDPSVSEFRLTRVLMGVREINGKAVAPLTNEVERTKLANRIGDEGIDLLFYYDRTYWPPLRQVELPQVKKRVTSAIHRQLVHLVQHGFGSWAEVCSFSDTERFELYLASRQAEGWTIDWSTGEATPPRKE